MKHVRFISILFIATIIIGCSKEEGLPKPHYESSICNLQNILFDSILYTGGIYECKNYDPVYSQITSTAKTILISDSVAKIEIYSSDLTKDTTLLVFYKCIDKPSISLKYFDNIDTLGFHTLEFLFIQYRSDLCDYNHYFQGYRN